jgi:hypothetical protein
MVIQFMYAEIRFDSAYALLFTYTVIYQQLHGLG